MQAMKRAYFITATGTDLGKTWLTAGVADLARRRGIPVRALKPVMSGYDAADPQASDAGLLLAKVGAGDTVESISPWRFAAPLAPDRAAAREGRSIDFAELAGWCRAQVAANPGLLLIEGIGGVMVPLDATRTVRELIAALGIPVVLVAGTYLGALSHTLTALAALREAGVVPAVVALNESAGSSVSLEDSAASLAPHLGAVPLRTLRRDGTVDLAALADLLLEPDGGR
jgi:dethiobiotin synthetase